MPRRVLSLAACASILALLVVAAPAGAGKGPSSTLTVTKVVVGEVPAGTEFTITVDCSEDFDDTTLTFDAAGGDQSTPVFSSGNSCTVTETVDGGATSVSYECRIDDPGNVQEPSTCQGNQTVQFDARNTFATITVTNTFPDAPAVAPAAAAPATAVVAATPTFTG